MRRFGYEVHCPGCGKRIRGESQDECRARMVRHIRNCNALRKMAGPPESGT